MNNRLRPSNGALLQDMSKKYNNARYNLLLVVAFSALNLILLALGADVYLLFSASVPYFLSLYALLLCGKLPLEYYGGEEYYLEMEAEGFLPGSVATVALVISALMILGYLAFFFLSKNLRVGWMVAAFVFFILDTVGLLLMADLANSIPDLIFHTWVLAILLIGFKNGKKLKRMPAPTVEEPAEATAEEAAKDFDSTSGF